ncbi:nucleotide exchange factor GrpE [Roseimaritima sediminicola]|uniref:nucleotide exchange factor GrpE n=1 Tax=Roseimaritima sediminicola TaxID=2662066 RepID=UPI00129850BD|nr:nucleotide exchange factor GrpE [Roseimaritima sediminicola]
MNEPQPPSFGLVDVIEAFTAMRHEFRTQSSEDRKLADKLAAATAQISELEQGLHRSAAQLSADMSSGISADREAQRLQQRRLCETLAEIDFHLSRTVQTAVDSLRPSAEADSSWRDHLRQQVDQELQRCGAVRRWLLGGWLRRFATSCPPPPAVADAAVETSTAALEMLLQRVQRLVREADVERIDVQGAPFDGNLMSAVESVVSDRVPAGHVVTQLCPAYRWQGDVIRYAEVHVSRN